MYTTRACGTISEYYIFFPCTCMHEAWDETLFSFLTNTYIAWRSIMHRLRIVQSIVRDLYLFFSPLYLGYQYKSINQ